MEAPGENSGSIKSPSKIARPKMGERKMGHPRLWSKISTNPFLNLLSDIRYNNYNNGLTVPNVGKLGSYVWRQLTLAEKYPYLKMAWQKQLDRKVPKRLSTDRQSKVLSRNKEITDYDQFHEILATIENETRKRTKENKRMHKKCLKRTSLNNEGLSSQTLWPSNDTSDDSEMASTHLEMSPEMEHAWWDQLKQKSALKCIFSDLKDNIDECEPILTQNNELTSR